MCFTMEEVAEHNTEKSAWFVHEGSVYDGTPYLEDHPGGGRSAAVYSVRQVGGKMTQIEYMLPVV